MKGKLLALSIIAIAIFCPAHAMGSNGMYFVGYGAIQRSMGGANVGLPLDTSVIFTNPGGMGLLGKRIDAGISYFDADLKYRAHSGMGMIVKDNETIHSDVGGHLIPFAGIAYPVNDRVTLGIGVNCGGMKIDYEKNIYSDRTFVDYASTQVSPAASYKINDSIIIGTALNIVHATLEYKLTTPLEPAHNDGEEFGVGATFGALFIINPYLSAGASYHTKTDFPDFEFDTGNGEDRLDFNLPQKATIGLGLRPVKDIKVIADITWIDWPQTHGKKKPAYTKNSSGSAPWDLSWDEQVVYKVGVEWNALPKLSLRGGFNYGRHPLDSSRAYENIAFPAIAESHYTFGAGFLLNEKISLNIGFLYAPKVSFTSSNAAQGIDKSIVEMSQKAVDFGISYQF